MAEGGVKEEGEEGEEEGEGKEGDCEGDEGEECDNCMAEEDNPGNPCPYHTDYFQVGYDPKV